LKKRRLDAERQIIAGKIPFAQRIILENMLI
jgi:hypothetical protein